MSVRTISTLLFAIAATGPANADPGAPTSGELAGCYRWESDSGWSSLRLRPDGGYVAYTTVGLGLLAKATGGWELEGRELVLGPSREVRGWFEHAGPAVIVSRTERGQLVLTGALGKFLRVPHDSSCGP